MLVLLPRQVAAHTGQYINFSQCFGFELNRSSYTILLYTQPQTFVAPDGLNVPDVGVDVFVLSDYVKVRACQLILVR